MNTETLPAGLKRVRRELESWRARRSVGARIPEEVWRSAACAVREYGLNRVSRALRLDYYHLKKHADGAAGASSPMFVELSAGGHADGAGPDAGLACVVELAKGNGTRMRICVREASGVDWGKLTEAFLGA